MQTDEEQKTERPTNAPEIGTEDFAYVKSVWTVVLQPMTLLILY